MMKKLLLVMLVPVMVLGLLSCGKVFDGEKVISAMQGGWADANSEVAFVLSPNQAVVFKANYADWEYGTIAFRTESTGEIGSAMDITTKATYDGEIHFYDFEDGSKKEMGWVKVTFTPDGSSPEDDILEVTESTKIYHYQNYMVPPVGIYNRLVTP